MGTRMTHPDLPGQPIDVVDPRGVPIHRQSGWRTDDEYPDGKPPWETEAERRDITLPSAQAAADNKE